MSEQRRMGFEQSARRASRCRPGDDPSPVFDALGHALWLAALGELGQASAATRATLREQARTVLLGLGALRGAAVEQDAGEQDEADAVAAEAALGGLEAMAHAGLGALSGSLRAPAAASKLHVPDATLARMYRGETDGLTAGRHALHMLGCERCRRALAALRFGADWLRAEPLAVAAAAPEAMRAPSEGRRVASLEQPALEAVLFDDGRIAVYADGHEPVRLVAEGLTTEATLGGYFLGRIAQGTTQLDATVYAGAESRRWTIALDA